MDKINYFSLEIKHMFPIIYAPIQSIQVDVFVSENQLYFITFLFNLFFILLIFF